MAEGHSSVLSPRCAVLVNVLIHGLEIEADEATDDTGLIQVVKSREELQRRLNKPRELASA